MANCNRERLEGSLFNSYYTRRGSFSFRWIAPLTLVMYLIMLSVTQRGIKYHFKSLRYDSTWNWTPVSWTISEHSNPYANGVAKPICLHKMKWSQALLSNNNSFIFTHLNGFKYWFLILTVLFAHIEMVSSIAINH